MTFDISKLAAAETTDVHLRDPGTDDLLHDENGKPVTVTVYGPGSKPYAKARSAAENRAIDKFKRKGKTDQTPEEKLENTVAFLSACTVSLNNFDYKGASDAAAIKAMYGDRTIGFINDQVDKAMGDWANFTKPSETASASS